MAFPFGKIYGPNSLIRLIRYTNTVRQIVDVWRTQGGSGPPISPAKLNAAFYALENSFEKDGPGQAGPRSTNIYDTRAWNPSYPDKLLVRIVIVETLIGGNMKLYFAYRVKNDLIFGDSDERPLVECEDLVWVPVNADAPRG